MGGSAVSAALAAQEAARAQRRFEREVERRRERRKGVRALAALGKQLERLTFPCASACLGCGFLELPSQVGGDPMRTDTTALVPWEQPCPACARRAWVDLAVVAHAEALREHELREIELRRDVAPALRTVVSSVAVAVLALFGTLLHGISGVLTGPLVIVSMVFVGHAMRRVIAGASTPRRSATRWRAPSQHWRAGGLITRGRLGGAAARRAPISGRAALGWRVEVRYPGDRGDAFALVEQDCRGLTLDGVELGLEPTLGTAAVVVKADAAEARRYLLARGIDPNDTLEIRERVALADTSVTLREEQRGHSIVLTDA